MSQVPHYGITVLFKALYGFTPGPSIIFLHQQNGHFLKISDNLSNLWQILSIFY